MMNTLTFSIDIDAEASTIWKALWDDASYRDWAGVFFEGSYAVFNNLEEGGTVLFLAKDKSGIYSMIEKHIPNETIVFKHIGSVLNGKKQPVDDEVKKWSGAIEMYTIIKKGDVNILSVAIDVMDKHLDFMKATFPKALEVIRKNSA